MPATDRGEAKARDTIEVQIVKGTRVRDPGLQVRASARMVEAARKSRSGKFTPISAERVFRERD